MGFIKQLVIVSLVIIAISAFPLWKYASQVQMYGIICGFAIGLLNAVIGYFLNTLAFNKPTKSFMVIVFGGMGLRMILIAILLLILLYFAKFDEVSLVGSVFFFYMLYVSLEIAYLHKKQLQDKKNTSK